MPKSTLFLENSKPKASGALIATRGLPQDPSGPFPPQIGPLSNLRIPELPPATTAQESNRSAAVGLRFSNNRHQSFHLDFSDAPVGRRGLRIAPKPPLFAPAGPYRGDQAGNRVENTLCFTVAFSKSRSSNLRAHRMLETIFSALFLPIDHSLIKWTTGRATLRN